MTKLTILLLALIPSQITFGQSLHSLEPSSAHYTILEKLDPTPNPLRSPLDSSIYNDRKSGLQFVGIEPTYLTQENVEFLKNSLKFPANSSNQTRAELDFLLEWQEKRTKAQRDRSMEIAPIGYWPPLEKTNDRYGSNVDHLFWEYRSITGNSPRIENYLHTTRLLAGVTRDMRIMEFTVKYALLRARPYHIEPKLNPMARISSPSFASGHTLWAYIQAFTWSELLPEKRKEFLAIAYEVGESREIMGIHYPSDEEAARILAHKMLLSMWKNPVFIQDLKKAQSEW